MKWWFNNQGFPSHPLSPGRGGRSGEERKKEEMPQAKQIWMPERATQHCINPTFFLKDLFERETDRQKQRENERRRWEEGEREREI